MNYVAPEMKYPLKIVFANNDLLGSIIIGQMKKKTSSNATVCTTIAPTVINAGIKENVLPGHGEALINLRILPGDSISDILSHFTKVINDTAIKLTVLKNYVAPSKVSSTEATGFKNIQMTIHQLFPNAVVAPFLFVARTDSKHYEVISDNIYRFMPLTVQKDDLQRIHGHDERISVENYYKLINFYKALIEKN